MKQPVVLAHDVEQAFRGHHRKGLRMEGERYRTAGDLTGERKGKVPEARERDVGKGKDGCRMGGWREIGDDDVGGGVRGERVCLFVAWCEGGVEWQVWR
jgi:hypothetical protein